ncbi:MAG: enoyl-CoA hydratase/isomerase family protein [Chloroflexia bacterium]|nr:enoyl-CoA hydratase/isomerase family protein [Chloroflexia bacterium]
MTGDQESVLVERNGYIATLTLNRPRYRNAINFDTLDQLDAAADGFIENPPRVLILKASAPGFCSGIDLKESREATPDFARKRVTLMHAVLGKLRRMPIPIVAAIDGVAVGLGCELVISADIRLATASSTFGYPEPRVAVPSPAHHLVWLIGLARAQDLLLTARTVAADEAAVWGLITRIEGDVEAAAREAARQIAELAPFSIAKTKENIALSIAPGSEGSSRHHIDGVHQAASMSDRKEALAAFAEKRKPVFTGE